MTCKFDVSGLDLHDPIFRESFVLEASAGTGKTFSIEHIFVRLVLLGVDPHRILLMTFTRKATSYMRSRIAKCLYGVYQQICSENVTHKYLQDSVLCLGSNRCIHILQHAISVIDDLHIFTIHGFCLFLLKRNVGCIVPDVSSTKDVFCETRIKCGFLQWLANCKVIEYEYIYCVLKYVFKWDENRFLGKFMSLNTFKTSSVFVDINELSHIKLKLLSSCLFVDGILSLASSIKTPFKGVLTKERKIKKNVRDLFLRFESACMSTTISIEDVFIIHEAVRFFSSENVSKRHIDCVDMSKIDEIVHEFHSIFGCIISGEHFWRLVSNNFLDPNKDPDSILHITANYLDKGYDLCSDMFDTVIVDEFQDTDPVQWEIFKKTFSGGHINIILVGDPKQSIYGFRNSDVYTYFDACNSIDLKFSLQCNFRSKKSLSDGLNFLFCNPRMTGWMNLPKINSCCDVKSVSCFDDEENCKRIHFLSYEGSLNHVYQKVASAIWWSANIGVPFANIAVLVSTHDQGEDIGKFLSDLRIPICKTRYSFSDVLLVLSWFEDIFTGAYNTKMFKKALLTPFFNLSILDLHKDVSKYEPIFVRLSSEISNNGVESAIGYLFSLKDPNIYKLLYEHTSKCLLEIFEEVLFLLFQTDGLKRMSVFEIIEWIKLCKKRPPEIFTRIDTERSINIITMHASKGLEFEVVVALGVSSRSSGLSIEGTSIDELDAEKMRVLYVALTRAKSHLFIPIDVSTNKKVSAGRASPIDLFAACFDAGGYDLIKMYGIINGINSSKFIDFLNGMHVDKLSPISLDMHEILSAVHDIKDDPLYVIEPSVISHTPCKAYVRTSFSSICKPHIGNVSYVDKGCRWDCIPIGNESGSFIHKVLQLCIIDKQIFKSDEDRTIRKLIAMSGLFDPSMDSVIKSIVRDLFVVDLGGFCLDDVNSKHCLVERSFLMLDDDVYWDGIIDLVFLHNGSVFVLDWKSNWLDDFSHESMCICINHNMYDSQIDLYLKAVRKYMPRHDIAGGIVFFVRGFSSVFISST